MDTSLSPLSILIVKKIQNQICNRSLCVQFDSGSDASHIQQRSLPRGLQVTPHQQMVIGVMGKAAVTGTVQLADMILPEFS